MPIIPWRPFADLWDRFFEDEGWAMPAFPKMGRYPAMDVYETDKEVTAEINLPSIDPKNIEVSVKDQVLYVSGREEEKKEEKGKDYWRREIRHGSFERAVRLPSPVDEKSVEATYGNGLLKIVMKKIKGKGKSAKKVPIKIQSR